MHQILQPRLVVFHPQNPIHPRMGPLQNSHLCVACDGTLATYHFQVFFKSIESGPDRVYMLAQQLLPSSSYVCPLSWYSRITSRNSLQDKAPPSVGPTIWPFRCGYVCICGTFQTILSSLRVALSPMLANHASNCTIIFSSLGG